MYGSSNHLELLLRLIMLTLVINASFYGGVRLQSTGVLELVNFLVNTSSGLLPNSLCALEEGTPCSSVFSSVK